jgi:hypothetical protein
MGLDAYSFEKCTFQNRYGSDYVPSYLLDFSVYSFSDNSITFAIPPDKNVSSTFNISDQAGIAFGQGQSGAKTTESSYMVMLQKLHLLMDWWF